MTWLRNRWYQAGWSDELKAGEPLVRTILAEPILFYRTADGTPAALFDSCPHRFAPLSAGEFDGDTVVCGYHGLGFGPNGACTRNPHGPITSALRVRSYPVVERHLAMWIWMGAADLADPALIPDLSFIDETPDAARIRGSMPTKANYQLLVDNILDLSHADYLHPTSLGGMMTASKMRSREDGDKILVSWVAEDCDPPGAFKPIVPEGKADIWIDVTWQAPALMILETAAKPAGVPKSREDGTTTLHNIVPETETTSHYFFCSTRRFLVDDAKVSSYLRGALEQAFQGEDKPMLERQQARMVTPDLWALDPVLLPIDAGAVRVRRKLDKMIAAEQVAAPAPTDKAAKLPVEA